MGQVLAGEDPRLPPPRAVPGRDGPPREGHRRAARHRLRRDGGETRVRRRGPVLCGHRSRPCPGRRL